MKVLLIEPCFENFGGYFRAFAIAKTLAQKGHRVDLLISHKQGFYPYIRKKKINKNLTQYELPRFEINFFLNGRILRGLLASLFVVFKKYDIIHTFVPVQLESNIPTIVARFLKKKLTMDWDDYWQKSPLYKNYNFLRRYCAICENFFPKFVKNMTVTSEFLKEKAKDSGAKNILKIINGVNLKQFKTIEKREAREFLKIPKDEKVLLTFGHTLVGERALYLFKAFEEIYRRDNSIKLIINLDPKKIIQEEKLFNKVNPKMLNNIINVGYIKPNMLGYYLGACNFVIFLIGNKEHEKACFPVRIGSFLNGERIIVTNDTQTEACNILKKYQCAVIGQDFKDIAEKVIFLFQNPEAKQLIEKDVKKAKRKLAWQSLANELISFYERI